MICRKDKENNEKDRSEGSKPIDKSKNKQENKENIGKSIQHSIKQD